MISNSDNKRVVSLCPSITQTIIDLGKENVLFGITDYCPSTRDSNSESIRIGGPKKVNFNKIHDIRPDLILFVKEENSLKDFILLNSAFNCVAFDIRSITASLKLLKTLGRLLNAENISEKIIRSINTETIQIKKYRRNYYYFVWDKPSILAGSETYIHSILEMFGLNNLVTQSGYPEIPVSDLSQNVNYIFLPDEPYHFRPDNSSEIISTFTRSKFIYQDGRICSWFGSYTLKGIRELKTLAHRT